MPKLVPFWKMKLAVHHAKPSGTETPPTLSQNSEINQVPGPRPTGGRSTPLGVVGTVALVGAVPVDPPQALMVPPLALPPFLDVSIDVSGTPLAPAFTTCW